MDSLWIMFQYELLRLPKVKYFYWKRCLLIASVGFYLLFYISDAGFQISARNLFINFTFVTVAVLTLIVPISAENNIIQERLKGTLPLLLITDLSPWQIVFGKFLSLSLSYLLSLFSCLPIVFICVSFGGINIVQVFLILAMITAFVLFAISSGFLFASFTSSRSRSVSFWFIAIYFAVGMYLNIPYISIWLCSFELINVGDCPFCLPHIGIHFVLTGLFLCISSMQITKSITRLIPVRRIIKRKYTQVKAPYPIKGNPVAWRDYYKVHNGKPWSCFGCAAQVFITAMWALVCFVPSPSVPFFNAMLSLCIIFGIITFFSLFWSCALAFQKEDIQCLGLLLCAGMSPHKIVQGKIQVLWWRGTWLKLLLLCVLYLCVVGDDFVRATIGYWFAWSFSMFAFVLYISLTSISTRSALLKSSFLVVPWFMMFSLMFVSGSFMVAWPVIVWHCALLF